MKLKDLEMIMKILDSSDSGYTEWYGTEDDVVDYLRTMKDKIDGYNEEDGFIKNLERYGLTFKIIN